MRDLVRWDPFVEMEGLVPAAPAFNPSFEVKETKEGYVFKADLPGTKEDDLDISLTGNRLTISGKREEEQREANERYFACERSYGSFSRSFTLPDGCDSEHVTADLRNGVLTVSIPKKPDVQPRRISVGGAAQTQNGKA